MRKVLVFIVVVLLGTTVFALAGCGNTGEAKKQMKAADLAWDNVYAKITELSSSLTSVLAPVISGNFSALTENVPALTKAAESVDTITKELDGAEKLYTSLRDLNVGGYTEYADAMIKTIGATNEIISLGKELLAKMMPVIQTGDAAQINAFFQQNMAMLTQAQTVQATAQSELDAAKKIKTDKKLGQ
jgi:hypothetical protein